MSKNRDLLDDLLRGAASPKANKTPGANKANKTAGQDARRTSFGGGGKMQQAGRIAQRTPEVMVKVSGGARGGKHVREHLNYITRNGKLTAETDQGEKLEGRDAVRELAAGWSGGDRGNPGKNGQRRSRDTVNLVMSMPPGTNADSLRDAVRAFAARNFSADREYVFVRHDDTDHPHCHLTLNAHGHDGRRLNPRKADLQAWRESFAQCLREQGVAAEASPRRTRGVVKKGKKQAVRHAEAAGRSTVARAKVDEAIEAASGRTAVERPWEAATARKQEQVREGWGKVAERLEAAGSAQAAKLAATVRQFVKDMPPVVTERQDMERKIRARLAQHQNAKRDRDQAGKER